MHSDAAEKMDAKELVRRRYELLYLPSDMRVDSKDYKRLMEGENLSRRDQDYMNILATQGDTWRYLPGVIAWTIPGMHATFSHKELEPYGINARPHEQGHSVLMREIGPHREHQVDQLVNDPSRNYKLGLIRLSY